MLDNITTLETIQELIQGEIHNFTFWCILAVIGAECVKVIVTQFISKHFEVKKAKESQREKLLVQSELSVCEEVYALINDTLRHALLNIHSNELPKRISEIRVLKGRASFYLSKEQIKKIINVADFLDTCTTDKTYNIEKADQLREQIKKCLKSKS